ncbi:STAS domain-containing protein [Evansella tamaricis]|uniref:STAS domain-containing protein n=1 Tax=Evansella tamaricis TaxID=2069301 RepID=A0ABS6JHQ1_9BACI|nr:STAS domain-containing protein [Evansella tamaricis]MBU9711863.1 STAS domain-containing protein [Evansella tamaricis]
MNLNYEEHYSIKDFLINNQEKFEEGLLKEATNVKDKINEIHRIGNINLLGNAHKVVMYIVEDREEDLINFAKYEGIAWAKHSLTLSFKLEWVQAIRRTLWVFLHHYDLLSPSEIDRETFFVQEKKVNVMIDHFFTHFFMAYSKFKDELLEKQRRLVESLSVPIIPIHTDVCVLPLIGELDSLRLTIINEKILTEIGSKSIQTLILDLSGVAPMEEEAVVMISQMIDSVFLMGCKTVITGLRHETVMSLRSPAATFNNQVEYRGTLQLAMKDVSLK